MGSKNNDTEINIFSAFDGMSCLHIALNKLSFHYDNYFASEISKSCIKITNLIYPNTKQLGDIKNVRGSDLPTIFLMGGGSPCQSFSFAGKRKGMSTKCEIDILSLDHYLELKNKNFEFEGESYLFWEYVRLLKEIKPKYFLLENVQMIEKWRNVISKAIGVNPLRDNNGRFGLNASLVSAQSRDRLYWTNIGLESGGLFGDLQSIIKEPKDKGIILRDILEEEVDEKYYLSKKALDRINRKGTFKPQLNPDKTGTLNTKNNSGQLSVDHGTTLIGGVFFDESFRPIGDKSLNIDANYSKGPDNNGQRTVVHVTKLDIDGNKKSNQEKASALTVGGHGAGNHSDMDVNHVQRKVIQVNESEQFGTQPQQQNRVYDPAGDIPAVLADLSSGSHHIIVHNKMPRSGGKKQGGTGPLKRNDGKTYALYSTHANEIEFKPIQIDSLYEQNSTAGRIDSSSGKSVTLKGEGGGGGAKTGLYETESRIRRLTPLECARLQTVPDSYITFANSIKISDTALYRMLGNGWCVDMICHILSYMK